MIKPLHKQRIKGTYLSIIKDIYIQQTPNQPHSEWGKAENISFKIQNTRRMSAPLQCSTKNYSQSNQARYEIKELKMGKKEVKLSLVADNMILYVEDSKSSTRKFPELINAASYQFTKSIYKNQSLSYTPAVIQ